MITVKVLLHFLNAGPRISLDVKPSVTLFIEISTT